MKSQRMVLTLRRILIRTSQIQPRRKERISRDQLNNEKQINDHIIGRLPKIKERVFRGLSYWK